MSPLLSRLRGCICLLTYGDGCIIKGSAAAWSQSKVLKTSAAGNFLFFPPFFVVSFFSRFQDAIKCTPLVWVVGRLRSKTILGEFQWREGEEQVRGAAIKADINWGLLGLGNAKQLCLFWRLINIGGTFRMFLSLFSRLFHLHCVRTLWKPGGTLLMQLNCRQAGAALEA